ncbi:MAG: TrkH family potassium uptake protein [Thermoleophilia bacterium]|nr:TrkH family potassium uptake protein [Thermoleophilia bacterium]
MALPLLVSIIYLEFYSAVAFLLGGLITGGAGFLIYRLCRSSPEPESKHGYITAAVGWLSLAFWGALPYFIAGLITPPGEAKSFVPPGETYESSLASLKNPLSALFESMSGYTTTGLTMIVHEPSVGHGLLFYRSLTQWIGGVGVIVLALAILRRPSGSKVVTLFASETKTEKLRPNIIGTARVVWKIYLVMTVLVAVFLLAGTLLILPDYGFLPALFDSVNHAMTGMATGGFSVLDDSIAGYGSSAMELLYMLPMFMGAISIGVYYKALKQRNVKAFWKDIQFRLLVAFAAAGVPILILLLLGAEGVGQPLLSGGFQFLSGLTGTGWQTSNIAVWPAEAIIFIVAGALIVGGSIGSTVGGIKIIRAYWIIWGIRWKVLSAFLPARAVQTAKIGGKVLNVRQINREMAEVAIFVYLYLIFVLLGTILTIRLAGDGFSLAHAFFESASAQGTVGLSTGITDPAMSPFLKGFYILQMWTGRLEIIPVLVLIRSIFWGTKARRI